MKKGDKVEWKWGAHKAQGRVKEIFDHPVTKKLKESDITRNGSKENKALLIEQEDGDQILRLETEVDKVKE